MVKAQSVPARVSEASRFASSELPYSVRRSPFTVHRSPFTVRRSPFAVRRSPCAGRSQDIGNTFGSGHQLHLWNAGKGHPVPCGFRLPRFKEAKRDASLTTPTTPIRRHADPFCWCAVTQF